MKKLSLVSSFLLIGSIVWAQSTTYLRIIPKKSITNGRYSKPKQYSIQDSTLNSNKLKEKLLNTALSNGLFAFRNSLGAVFFIRPDQMPCIVPDKEQLAAMPNANPLGRPPAPMPGASKSKK